MPLQVYNTLTARKENFTPLEEGRVKMYVCGITPYDESHLGHARCYVTFDTIRRFLILSGYQVRYVQNFTDIDDKIIARAKTIGQPPLAVADRFIQDYFAKMRLLGVREADAYPRVTQTIPDIVQFIAKLVLRGRAYPLDGDVFYSVRTFPDYGKLSKRALDDMESGARVEVDERKKDPLDFALWKKAKEGEPAWDSPWGPGRPGWHIECSVMSIKHLGETFDMHGGGQDLIFPHHENEIAQSEGATGQTFARYWLHNGFVMVNQEKMSKSLGNFFTLGDIFKQVAPEVVRFLLLTRHYRTPLDFSEDLFVQSKNAFDSLKDADAMATFLLETNHDRVEPLEEYRKEFVESMNDDFNTEKAIAAVFKLRNAMVDKIKSRDLEWLRRARFTLRGLCNDYLGLPLQTDLPADLLGSLKDRLARRDEARKGKDWAAADALRKEIEASGYLVEDTPAGPVVKPKR